MNRSDMSEAGINGGRDETVDVVERCVEEERVDVSLDVL